MRARLMKHIKNIFFAFVFAAVVLSVGGLSAFASPAPAPAFPKYLQEKIAKQYPNAKSAKQSEIDAVFQEEPVPQEIKETLGKGTHGVEVVKASSGTLGSRPAHVAWVRYQEETALGPAAVYGRVAMTATPGLTWTLACSSQGIDPGDAERTFTLWNNEINGIFTSFTLPQ